MTVGPVPADSRTTARSASPRGRTVAWGPGADTWIALASLVAFSACYWAGSALSDWFLYAGIGLFGTLVPAWTVLHPRQERLSGLGFGRRFLAGSLLVSAVLGLGPFHQLFALAAELNVPVLPHLLANLLVFWEPFFSFGWLFLQWERAFGWVPAMLLSGVGFALQHLGSVPVTTAIGFGMFSLVFSAVFVFVRSLAIPLPLFYPIAGGIGTLQAGFTMGWNDVATGAGLLLVQALPLAVLIATRRAEPRYGVSASKPSDQQTWHCSGRAGAMSRNRPRLVRAALRRSRLDWDA